jgi:Fe-S cluster assembly protein SufD
MNVAVIKTKAEQSIAEAFETQRTALPGGKGAESERVRAFSAFASRGLPSRRVEAWKYTDLRTLFKDVATLSVRDDTSVSSMDLDAALGSLATIDAWRMVFVNGHFRRELSQLEGLNGVEVKSLGASLVDAPDAIAEALLRSHGPDGDSMIALNSALATDGVVVKFKADAAPSKALFIVNVMAGTSAKLSAVRNLINVGEGAAVQIVETCVSLSDAVAGQILSSTETSIGNGATVSHVQISNAAGSQQVASTVARLGVGSHYRAFQFTSGPHLVRNQAFVTFQGENSTLDLSGAFLARGNAHIDTTLVVDHAVPNCESRELFKGVLDERARGIFQGKVIVRQDAQKTNGKQMAQALMLSEDAEFDSKPELEIYADDVVCGHGSTAAEIDPALLFYLGSRGIPKDAARALLIESFVGDVLEKIESETLRDALMALARNWVGQRQA